MAIGDIIGGAVGAIGGKGGGKGKGDKGGKAGLLTAPIKMLSELINTVKG